MSRDCQGATKFVSQSGDQIYRRKFTKSHVAKLVVHGPAEHEFVDDNIQISRGARGCVRKGYGVQSRPFGLSWLFADLI